MTEHQLETFLAIVKHGSYSRAAENLYISQPTVSYRIRTLEKELGVRLFTYVDFQARLTPAGASLVQEAEQLCSQMKALRTRMTQFSPARTLTIGFPEMMLLSSSHTFLRIMQLLPESSVTLHSIKLGRPPEDVQQLLRGEADLIFTDLCQPALDDSRFGKRKLFNEMCTVCMRRDHPLAGEAELTLNRLRGEVIRRYDDLTFFLDQIEGRLAALGMALQGDGHLPFIQLLPQLALQGGVVITNQRPVPDANLVYIPLRLEPTNDIGVAWRKNDCPPPLKQLIHALAALPADSWR